MSKKEAKVIGKVAAPKKVYKPKPNLSMARALEAAGLVPQQ
jgi:hypothetical protein